MVRRGTSVLTAMGVALVIMILLAFDTPAWARLRGQFFAGSPAEEARNDA